MEEQRSSFEERFSIDKETMGRDAVGGRNSRIVRRKSGGNNLVKGVAVAGVLITTLVVMFVLLRGGDEGNTASETQDGTEPAMIVEAVTLPQLEQRLKLLERSLAALVEKGVSSRSEVQAPALDMTVFAGRLERVETAMTAKFSIMIENIDALELQAAKLQNRISALEKGKVYVSASSAAGGGDSSKVGPKNSIPAGGKVAGNASAAPSAAATKPAAPVSVKTALKKSTKKKSVPVTAPTVQKKVVSPNHYHVVRKGETFFSISQKYGITVKRLHELNNFSTQPIIYPGDKLIVK